MPSEEKNYEQSALGQRVNELMDDGYEFGEAVKQAMSEGLKDGGSVGIEILFGPKVPAAPSQLVSESDILLGYRGDAAYRSGSEQSKSIGQGNVGSKASFGGGQGTDRSGRSEGASGARMSPQLEAQRYRNMVDRNTPKEPNIIDKIVDNPLAKLIDPRSKIALAMGGYKFLRDGIPKLEDLENEAINQELKNIQTMGGISPYADGGRVGFFMGGPALEGEALSIYNSMSAYGNDDQTIADKLQSLGMYTPPGSTPDTPDTTPDQTYGLQSGSDNFSPYNPDPNKIQSFKTDSRIAAANEADIRNKQLTSMGIKDPFADEISLSGAYYGDMPTDTSNQIGTQSMFAKAKQGLTGLMDNPLVNLISSSTPFGMAKNFFKGIGSKLPVNQRAIQENVMGNLGFAVNDIGQIVSTGDYDDESGDNVMAGYNLSRMTPDTFIGRINSIKNRKAAQTAASAARIKAIQEAQRKFELAEKLKADALLEAQLKKAQQEIAAKGYQDYGQGGADQATQDSYAGSDGSYAGQGEASDWGGGEKDGGIIGYRNGGLATMFTRRR